LNGDPSVGDSTVTGQYCSYYHISNVDVKDSIITLANSSFCPPLIQTAALFLGPVTGCGVMSILSSLVMIIWLYYRSTHNGIKKLFQRQCCTQSVSLFISAMIIGFSITDFAVFAEQWYTCVYKDFETSFWNHWACYLDQNHMLNCVGYCLWAPFCNVKISPEAGFFFATSHCAFTVLFCLYSWIGSWCCNCCCPGVEEVVEPSNRASVVTYTADLSAMHTNTITSASGVGSYTLYVHHGSQFPSKLSVNVSTFSELEVAISNNLELTKPFKIAVFDEVCKQYVLVTSLTLVPPQATIQLLFN